MTDLIFENYCINCEKLIYSNSIYCSKHCEANDELNKDFTSSNYSYTTTNHDDCSSHYPRSSNDGQEDYINNDYSPLVSPLPKSEISNDYLEHDSISLNYNLSSNPNLLISTSNNYKKWLNLYAK